MQNDNEFTLFGDIDEFTFWKKEWKDMPEFIQEDMEPWRTIEVCFADYFNEKGYNIRDRIIYVHFANIEDLRRFSNLINIPGITHETKYLRLNSIQDFSSLIKQKITDATPSIWFPEVTDEVVRNKRWVDEDDKNI